MKASHGVKVYQDAVETYGTPEKAAKALDMAVKLFMLRLELEAEGKEEITAPTAQLLRPHMPYQPAFVSGPAVSFESRSDNTFTFGVLGDTHAGSKYERLDILEDLFNIYAEEGVQAVLHTGNWIDGEARFNVYDLHTHGMDEQCRYLAKIWPKKSGLTTYAISGDDHEGWYAQRMGVDIGGYAVKAFNQAGRSDWVDLGYMEAPIRLVNSDSGAEAIASVVHPGGGSSYATSYAIQKIIEILDGGEKPAVGFYGHYHKLWYGNIRNVWCIQSGTQQDQTPFQRKKKIEVHVGGALVHMTQDPRTGAIPRCRVELIRYFNKGYYSGRWSHHGPVTQTERTKAGV